MQLFDSEIRDEKQNHCSDKIRKVILNHYGQIVSIVWDGTDNFSALKLLPEIHVIKEE